MFDEFKDLGAYVVCHNGLRVDVAFLNRMRQLYFDKPLRAENYVDTMALERALQIGRLPDAGETWRSFCERVYSAGGSKVKSSLLGHCRPKYNLTGPTESDFGHEADYDSWLTHRLIESYRGFCPHELKGITC